MSALILILAISILLNAILIYIMVKRKIDPSLKTKHITTYEDNLNETINNDDTVDGNNTRTDSDKWED